MAQPVQKETCNGSAALWITYLNIVLYALCFQLQRPVEPFLINSLGHDSDVTQTYGMLQSFFSTIQTIGSPLVGILLDRVGIRKTSALVFLASALSYAILAGATDLKLLFLSKVPTALQHAFLVAQATAATSTGDNAAARAQALGRMTTAYTIGATIGPAMGGYLVDEMKDLYLGAKLAVFGSLVSVVLSIMYLPDTRESPTDTSSSKLHIQSSFMDDVRNSMKIASRSYLWPLLVVKVVGGIAASMHSTALPLVLTENLKLDPSHLGLTMSCSMFSVAAFGAVAMAPLTASLGPAGMTTAGLCIRVIMTMAMATVIGTASESPLGRILVVSVLHSLASHVLATGLTTQTTGAVAKHEQGSLLGLEHGLFSLARIGGPPLGATLLTLGAGGFWPVAACSAAVDIFLIVSLDVYQRRRGGDPAIQSHFSRDSEHSD